MALAKEAAPPAIMPAPATSSPRCCQHDPANIDALAGLVRAAVARKDLAKATQFLAAVPEEQAAHAEIAAARAALELAETGSKAAGKLDELKARVARDPKDHQARYDLAAALFAAGEREAAIDELSGDRPRATGTGTRRRRASSSSNSSRPSGSTDPLTVAARRRLSAMLFS